MMKFKLAALIAVIALQGCASSGGNHKEYFQVAEGEQCRSPSQQNLAGWQGCPEILVENSEGHFVRVLLATPAREGDWVALRCVKDSNGDKSCFPKARKTAPPTGN